MLHHTFHGRLGALRWSTEYGCLYCRPGDGWTGGEWDVYGRIDAVEREYDGQGTTGLFGVDVSDVSRSLVRSPQSHDFVFL